MIVNRTVRAEQEFAHLERLLEDARAKRNTALAEFRSKAEQYIGKNIICDGDEYSTGKLVTIGQWHLNIVTDSGGSHGVPIVLTSIIELADEDERRAETDARREELQKRIEARRAEQADISYTIKQ